MSSFPLQMYRTVKSTDRRAGERLHPPFPFFREDLNPFEGRVWRLQIQTAVFLLAVASLPRPLNHGLLNLGI